MATDSPKDVTTMNKNMEDWRSQQIAGILMIVFFGTIAISYVIFLNTYVVNKEKDVLVNSTWFTSAMVALTFISSIIIVMIMNNTGDKTSYNTIIWILIVANVVIFANFFKKKEIKNIIQFDAWKKCVDNFFGYQHFGDGICDALKYDPPIFSYLSPFLILLFILFAFDATNIVAQIMNFIIIVGLMIENSFMQRLDYLFNFDFNNINFKSFNFIATIVSSISYIILLCIILYKLFIWINGSL
jgi:hypothetical protein